MRHMLGMLVAAAVLPAGATAATIHVNSNWRSEIDTITYTAGAHETNAVTLGSYQQYFRLDDPGAVITSSDFPSGLYCLGSLHTGLCTGGTYYDVVASLGDGNDSIDTSGPSSLVRSFVDGGPGNDRFTGGNATYTGGLGADDFRGADGRVDYSTSPGAVSVTLDDVANDGTAGEHDNVHSDIADIVGSPFGDNLQGSAAANYIDGGAGDDTLAGGAGNDELFGGFGNNVIDGGAGADFIGGGPGDDTIYADDGEADRIFCDAGTDTVYADAQDEVDSSCENVVTS